MKREMLNYQMFSVIDGFVDDKTKKEVLSEITSERKSFELFRSRIQIQKKLDSLVLRNSLTEEEISELDGQVKHAINEYFSHQGLTFKGRAENFMHSFRKMERQVGKIIISKDMVKYYLVAILMGVAIKFVLN